MKKLIGFSLVMICAIGILSARPRQASETSPVITMKNHVGSPVKVIDASAKDGIFQTTLQFDDSASWNAYAIRWTLDYGPDHKHTFGKSFDKMIDANGRRTAETFAPNYVTTVKSNFTANDKNGAPLKLQAAEVEVLFVIKYDGTTWGDITADTIKGPDGKETSPYLRIMERRKGPVPMHYQPI